MLTFARLRRFVPLIGIIIAVLLWQIAVSRSASTLVPGPVAAVAAIGELARKGLLLKYIVASLFRVTCGYLLALAVAIIFLDVSGKWSDEHWPQTMYPFINRTFATALTDESDVSRRIFSSSKIAAP